LLLLKTSDIHALYNNILMLDWALFGIAPYIFVWVARLCLYPPTSRQGTPGPLTDCHCVCLSFSMERRHISVRRRGRPQTPWRLKTAASGILTIRAS